VIKDVVVEERMRRKLQNQNRKTDKADLNGSLEPAISNAPRIPVGHFWMHRRPNSRYDQKR